MQVGFVGLGNVGAKLAGSLLRQGHRLHIRDLERDAATDLLAEGAIWADSGRALAAASERLEHFGPRVWSSQVVKRLEDDCGEDLRAPGLPEYLVDHEPSGEGAEVVIEHRQDLE